MIRPALHTLAGCFVCLPLFLNAVRFEGGPRAEAWSVPEHDVYELGEDFSALAPYLRHSTHADAPASRLGFRLSDYDIQGVDLARRQFARGLEKRKEKRRDADQSFEGLRELIEESEDPEIRGFLPAVDALEAAMDKHQGDEADYVDGFIADFAPLALYLQIRTGLPASVILAQIILESGWGASNITLLKNNVLGIGKCRESGEFEVEVKLAGAQRDLRVRCMADTPAYEFDSVGDGILYYVYLLLQNEGNATQYAALRKYVRENRQLAFDKPETYRNRVIKLIARGYHEDPEWYEGYLRQIVKIVDESGILPDGVGEGSAPRSSSSNA